MKVSWRFKTNGHLMTVPLHAVFDSVVALEVNPNPNPNPKRKLVLSIWKSQETLTLRDSHGALIKLP